MINRSFIIAQVLGAAGMIAIGLGIAGLNGASIHPMLAERSTALAVIGGGAVLVIIEMRIILPAILRRAREQQSNR